MFTVISLPRSSARLSSLSSLPLPSLRPPQISAPKRLPHDCVSQESNLPLLLPKYRAGPSGLPTTHTRNLGNSSLQSSNPLHTDPMGISTGSEHVNPIPKQSNGFKMTGPYRPSPLNSPAAYTKLSSMVLKLTPQNQLGVELSEPGLSESFLAGNYQRGHLNSSPLIKVSIFSLKHFTQLNNFSQGSRTSPNSQILALYHNRAVKTSHTTSGSQNRL